MYSQTYSRMDKVNSLLLHELDKLLQREKIEQKGNAEDIVLGLTKIETSRDLKHAKVYFTVYPLKFRGDAKKFLDNSARDWQKVLGQKITLKYIPKLEFFFDSGQANAMKVEKILNDLRSEN
jgi:ribosome-binding factor A